MLVSRSPPGPAVTSVVHATDDGEIATLTAQLDLNADGDTADPGEEITPVLSGVDRFEAAFGVLSGALGPREIVFNAVDLTGKSSSTRQQIFVADGGVLLAPESNQVVLPGSRGRVFVQTLPGLDVERIEIRVDSDGDGSIQSPGEVYAAGLGSLADTIEGSFAITQGASGPRVVSVEVFLTGGGSHLLTQSVNVADPVHSTGMVSQHKAFLSQFPNIDRYGRVGSSGPRQFLSTGERLFFAATHRISGEELWCTDGSAVGTILLSDTDPNKASGDADVPLIGIGTNLSDRASVGNRVIFTGHNSLLVGFGASVPENGAYIEPWVSDGTPTGTRVLRDILPGANESSNPAFYEKFGDTVWFYADDDRPDPKVALWKTDGTEAGTVPALPAFVPTQTVRPRRLQAVGGTLFFLDDLANLWKTDGSAAGTELVTQIHSFGSANVGTFVEGGGLLYFNAWGPEGWELWRSDGSASGTHLLRDISPPTMGGEEPAMVGQLGDHLYFSQVSEAEGRELWRTDGTTSGTTMVADINAGLSGSDPGSGVVFQGRLYFAANDQARGRELWRTDGTSPGTELVIDLNPGAASGDPGHLVEYNDLLYFAATHPNVGRELWQSGGDEASTALAVDIVAGHYDSGTFAPITTPYSGNPQHLTIHRDKLYFSSDDPHYRSELWVSDGTREGTHRLRNLEKPKAPVLRHQGGSIYLGAADGSTGNEPYRFDGVRLSRLADHHAGRGDSWVEHFRETGGQLVYSFIDALPFGTPNYRLGITDGSVPGTEEVPIDFTQMAEFTEAIGGLAYFRGSQFSDSELWRTDGTVSGTLRAADIRTGFAGSDPRYLTALGNRAAFSADDGIHGRELWISDGSTPGTTMVKDIFPGPNHGTPRHLFPWNGRLFFTASTAFNSHFLWKTDGSEIGTINLSAAYAGTDSGDPNETAFVSFDGMLYYSAVVGSDFELWRTNGEPGGSEVVKSIGDGGPRGPRQFLAAADRFYFVADGGSTGRELWVCDGTAAGTHLTRNIAGFNGSFDDSSEPEDMMLLGTHVVFTAWTRELGRELWVSDGTHDGTVNLIDLYAGPVGGLYDNFVKIGGKIYFTANDGIHGRELWATNGTVTGTQLVEDLVPGPGSAHPQSLSTDGTLLWYVADNGADDLSLRCLDPSEDPYELWLDRTRAYVGADRAMDADPDGNGLSNFYEYSAAGIGSLPQLDLETMRVSFTRWRDWRQRGLSYSLEFSTDLSTWLPVALDESRVRILNGDVERIESSVSSSWPGFRGFVQLWIAE